LIWFEPFVFALVDLSYEIANPFNYTFKWSTHQISCLFFHFTSNIVSFLNQNRLIHPLLPRYLQNWTWFWVSDIILIKVLITWRTDRFLVSSLLDFHLHKFTEICLFNVLLDVLFGLLDGCYCCQKIVCFLNLIVFIHTVLSFWIEAMMFELFWRFICQRISRSKIDRFLNLVQLIVFVRIILFCRRTWRIFESWPKSWEKRIMITWWIWAFFWNSRRFIFLSGKRCKCL